jgi:uncharacterized cupredoxin-like copper-binding protein
MSPRRLIAAVLPVVGVAALLGGCGSSDDNGSTNAATTPSATTPATATTTATTPTTTAPTGAGGVTVKLGEYFIRPSPASVSSGKVRFTATNTGQLAHEMVVIKTNLAPDQLPLSGSEADEKKAGEVPGEIEDVAPGQTKSATIKLVPGKYVFICNFAGHYKAGQRVSFTVQ